MIIQSASSSYCNPLGILICVSNKKEAFKCLIDRQTGDTCHYVN